MRNAAIALLLLATACRGENPPRDYQNHPPAMTHPVDDKSQSPSAHGLPGAAPEPSKGVEGQTLQPVDPPPTATTTSGTGGATTTGGTAPAPTTTRNPEGGAPENTTTTG